MRAVCLDADTHTHTPGHAPSGAGVHKTVSQIMEGDDVAFLGRKRKYFLIGEQSVLRVIYCWREISPVCHCGHFMVLLCFFYLECSLQISFSSEAIIYQDTLVV